MPIADFAAQATTATLPQPVNAADWLQTEPPDPDQILEDVLDKGDKALIVAASKRNKSFFQLQCGVSIAAKLDFLQFRIPKARRVLIFQFEIQPHHFHRRVRRICRALEVEAEDLGDRLLIVNARGLNLTLDGIRAIALANSPDVIIFDPLYKMTDAGENEAADMKALLRQFDAIALETGAAIFYIHHDPKGQPGDRDVRDRGAGSNVLGRDYDACFALTAHASEESATVVDVLCRNYPPIDPFTVLWDTSGEGYRFVEAVGIAPTKKTSANGRGQNLPALETYVPAALEIVKDKPVTMGVFKDTFRTKTGATHDRTKAFKDWATSGPSPLLNTIERKARGFHEKLIGLPEHIDKLRRERGLE